MTSPVAPNPNSYISSGHIYIGQTLDYFDRVIGDSDLQTYLPIFTSVPGSTAPLIGDTGVVEAWWARLLDIIHVWGRVRWNGANIDQGTGNNWFLFSLPVPSLGLPVATNMGRGSIVGRGMIRDSSNLSDSQPIGTHLYDANNVWFSTKYNEGSASIRQGIPWDWADGDVISFSARYRGLT